MTVNRRYSPVASGQGEPWQIMFVNVFNHLLRTTSLFPLRIPLDNIAEPCFPHELHNEGEKWEMLRDCFNLQGHVQFGIMIGKEHYPFWRAQSPIITDRYWPTPLTNQQTIVIGLDHPHRAAIEDWVVRATEHEEFLAETRMYLNRLFKTLKHPDWAQTYWPRIVPYMGKVPRATAKGMREPKPRQVNMDEELNDRIEQMLTAASLLPKDQDTNTWVGFHSERER